MNHDTDNNVFKQDLSKPANLRISFLYLQSFKKCPSGEIGRRTVFRSQRSKECAGSNPVLGT